MSRIANAAMWNSLAVTCTMLLQVVQVVLVGRFLSPEIFGAFTLVLILVNIMKVFGDMGLGQSFVVAKTMGREHFSALWWLILLVGLVMTGVFPWLVELLSWALSQPLHPDLDRMGWVFILIAPGHAHTVLFHRQMRFKRIAWIECVSMSIATTLMWFWLFDGYTYEGLVWSFLIQNALKSIGAFALGFRNMPVGFSLDVAAAWESVRYGSWYVANQVVGIIYRRADQSIIGALMGAESLGLYAMAWNLTIDPIQKLTPILSRVAFPAMAEKIRRGENLQASLSKYFHVVALTSFSVGLGLFAIAPELVQLWLGDTWSQVIPLVKWLAILAILISLATPFWTLLLAGGHMREVFRVNLLTLPVALVILAIAAQFGSVYGLIWALTGWQLVILGISHKLAQTYVASVPRLTWLQRQWAPMLAGVFMSVGVMLLSMGSLPLWFEFTVKVAFGVVLYCAAYLALARAEDRKFVVGLAFRR